MTLTGDTEMAHNDSRTGGLVHVYTGNGKGKTTAAWGLALRAVGRGMKVAVVRFLKPEESGEVNAALRLAPAIEVFGHSSPYNPGQNQRESAVLRSESRENLSRAGELIRSGKYDLVVLDEINMVLHYEFVGREEMLDLLAESVAQAEIVLTGRYAPQWLIDYADLVTEMVEIKHPGTARRGIEY